MVEPTSSRKMFIFTKNERIDQNYDFKNERSSILGRGAYGCVLRAKSKTLNINRAVKVISKSKVVQPERFLNEVEIIKSLDHPNVIKLFEIYEDKKYVYLVMEICEGGELFDRIAEKGSFTEEEARNAFEQIMKAIHYLHQNKICHRDLKPENLMFHSTKDNLIKLIDFGISKVFYDKKNESQAVSMKTKAGSAYYVSPEVLIGDYDQLCDIWSAGVILYIMLCGQPPFSGENDVQILEKVQKMKFEFEASQWKNISAEAKDLILKMIVPREKRLTSSQVLDHPWFLKKMESKTEMNLNFAAFKTFIQSEKLRRIILNMLASQLTEDEIKDLRNVFLRLDKDGDGLITYQAFEEGFKAAGQEKEWKEVAENIKKSGLDKQTKINYNEFLAAMIEIQNVAMREEKMKNTFKLFDTDGDGKISSVQLKKVLGSMDAYKNVPEDYWVDLVKEVDKDGDGIINYEEFLQMMNKYDKVQQNYNFIKEI